jgi:hypothetical protein
MRPFSCRKPSKLLQPTVEQDGDLINRIVAHARLEDEEQNMGGILWIDTYEARVPLCYECLTNVRQRFDEVVCSRWLAVIHGAGYTAVPLVLFLYYRRCEVVPSSRPRSRS